MKKLTTASMQQVVSLVKAGIVSPDVIKDWPDLPPIELGDNKHTHLSGHAGTTPYATHHPPYHGYPPGPLPPHPGYNYNLLPQYGYGGYGYPPPHIHHHPPAFSYPTAGRNGVPPQSPNSPLKDINVKCDNPAEAKSERHQKGS